MRSRSEMQVKGVRCRWRSEAQGAKHRADSTAAALVAVGCECCFVEVERVTRTSAAVSSGACKKASEPPAQLTSTLQAQQVGGPALQLLEQQLAPIAPVQVLCRAVGVHPAHMHGCIQPAGRCVGWRWKPAVVWWFLWQRAAADKHKCDTLTPNTSQLGCCK